MDWLITPDTQGERRLVMMVMMVVVVVVSVVHLCYVVLPEHWFCAALRTVLCLGIKSVVQVRAVGKLSASRAGVTGQARCHVITVRKDALNLEGHRVYREVFPCKLLLWGSFTTAGSNRSFRLVLLVWHWWWVRNEILTRREDVL